MSDLHLPIENYMLTPLQSAERDWLAQVTIRRCLARFGYDYPDPGARPTSGSMALAQYSVLARRYGVTDPASVHQWGYHFPRATATPGSGKAVLLAELPADERKVLTGYDPTTHGPATSYKGQPIPNLGCRNEPDRLLGGPAEGAKGPNAAKGGAVNIVDGLVAKLKAASFNESMADPRVVAVFKAWTACMKTVGYHEADPMRVPEGFPGSGTPSSAEIAEAQADVSCKARTNMAGIWFAVESEYQNAAIAENAKQLSGVKSALKKEVVNLQRLLRAQGAS
ncbi:hypothetical protein ACH47Z_46885 [Streptomyces sp. NPDC020192]|uniref:hypothetical protein n=1 Tax=Streptomyces sp. NPDC020192 TaxID=3365066 RepID=UPI0037982AB1